MEESLKSQQYCLKWNNHSHNISGVFERLRSSEQFIDVTLASGDHQNLKCHRLLLSAGSGYLEEILAQNPCDHPTIVLSQIAFEELKLLVDFMYAGEVAVEQEHLPKLLDAAKILKIKGLYETESESEARKDSEEQETPRSEPLKELRDEPLSNEETLPKIRKRKISTSQSPDRVSSSSSLSPKSPKSSLNPLFGVSNTYFVTTSPESIVLKSPERFPSDIPSLLSQSQLSLSAPPFSPKNNLDLTSKTSWMNSANISNKLFTASTLMSATPVRRYKQYTEDSLQQALKEIMEGQSINRSSMKFNIPARTLRDWMKRLNIKSVFTHSVSSNKQEKTSEGEDKEWELLTSKYKDGSFPSIKEEPNDEDEEEIDDDEEEKLKIDESH